MPSFHLLGNCPFEMDEFIMSCNGLARTETPSFSWDWVRPMNVLYVRRSENKLKKVIFKLLEISKKSTDSLYVRYLEITFYIDKTGRGVKKLKIALWKFGPLHYEN